MDKLFVPSGTVRVTAAVDWLAEQIDRELVARVNMDRVELRALELKRTGSTRLDCVSNVGNPLCGARPASAPRSRATRRSPDGTLSAADEGRLQYLRQQEACLDQLGDWIAVHLRQDLGEGNVEARAVTRSGEIEPVPAEAWRATTGQGAFRGRRLFWYLPGYPLVRTSGTPVIAETYLARWLGHLREAKRPLPIAYLDGSNIGIQNPAVASASVAARQPGAANMAGQTIRRRTAIPLQRANQWMLDVATAANATGELFGREIGVARCQADLNCTRDVARDAYTALPADLKQPRGKAAKRPA